ncbi:uncharacterized protein TNCV_4187921 [Trichonephila clavipes]|nr:uncharacterized protein TNCV_4187921 [Trichonephila clavipes]
MKTEIYATLFHSISTNQKPQHFKYPSGKDSWCFFQAALARGEEPGPHVKHMKTLLKEAHLAKIMSIYQRLASNEFQRCIRCVTPNANESLPIIICAFQCKNCIVIAQRKHLDDFLRGRNIERLECGRNQLEVSEELGIDQRVISRLWQRFQDDCNMSRCYSIGRSGVTTLNENQYI